MTTRRLSLYQDATESWGLIEGDALGTLARLPEDSIDCVVTDPPYGIGFHDEAWDGDAIHAAVADGARLRPGDAFERWTALWATECLRVLKPGGHLLAFGSPRTFHRLVAGVEDAEFEVRDQLLWLYAQGVPKSRRMPGGLGTGLKPAYEPILLARKPLTGTTRENLETWGTGALNIDATRIVCQGRQTDYWPANVVASPGPPLDARVSRLFFCAKATKGEREVGCAPLPLRSDLLYSSPSPRLRRNIHPTVKPVRLMRWLVRLVTPPGGIVLDPFAGSGTTGIAALQEDRIFLGIERESEYIDIACARITHWAKEQE